MPVLQVFKKINFLVLQLIPKPIKVTLIKLQFNQLLLQLEVIHFWKEVYGDDDNLALLKIKNDLQSVQGYEDANQEELMNLAQSIDAICVIMFEVFNKKDG